MAATRGFRKERRVLGVVDTNGESIDASSGLLRDQFGRWQVALGIGGGATALLTDEQVAELRTALDQSVADKIHLEEGR